MDLRPPPFTASSAEPEPLPGGAIPVPRLSLAELLYKARANREEKELASYPEVPPSLAG